jgi:hypothetical protein
MNEEKEPLVKIGALWKQPKSLQGLMGNARLIVLKNNYKEKENQPDYIVYVQNPKKKEETNTVKNFAPSINENESLAF